MARLLAVVAEDKLTQAVLHKCIAEYLPSFQICRSEVKNGRGNVQRELAAYAKLANTIPVLVGVDLDSDECAPLLLAQWNAFQLLSSTFLLRIAVREIEAWVLADRKRIVQFVGGESDDISKAPDSLDDPKRYFLDFARRVATEDLKRDLIPQNYDKKYPRIGPAYNIQMCDFVERRWRPHVAIKRSGSLARAIRQISELENGEVREPRK